MGQSRQFPQQAPESTPEPQSCTAGPGPENSFLTSLLSSGVAPGTVSREAVVQSMLQSSYELGNNAPRGSYNGSIFRNVDSRFANGSLNASFSTGGNGMRYNAGGPTQGQQLIYGSESVAENLAEMNAYPKKGQSPMANRTMLEAHYQASMNPMTGEGGVADVTTAAQQRGATRALTAPKGSSLPPLEYLLTGEHPYSVPQQVAKGVVDSGASGMRVPSAIDGSQIDVIPRNTNPAQLTPLRSTPYDSSGTAGPTVRATGVNAMVADTSVNTPGPQEAPPGQGLRGRSATIGGVGGGLVSFGHGLYRKATEDNVSWGDVGKETGLGATLGAGTSLAVDGLVARGLTLPKAGGAVGGLIEGGMSAWNNANAYRDGKVTGGQATANTVVDAGLGLGAGAAGAAAGAAIGSFVPIAGTALGAGLGFLGGMAVGGLTHWLANKSGAPQMAKRGLGTAFDAVGNGASSLWNAATDW